METLDLIPSNRRATAQVRERITQVIETEGPVQSARLARLVAGSFGLSRVHAERARSIQALVPGKADPEGFFWPAGQGPATWFRMRPDPQRQRRIEEIHSIEIANAMAELCRASGGLAVDDLLSQTARVFGFQRLGASTSEWLRKGLVAAQQTGRIRQEGDYFHPGR